MRNSNFRTFSLWFLICVFSTESLARDYICFRCSQAKSSTKSAALEQQEICAKFAENNPMFEIEKDHSVNLSALKKIGMGDDPIIAAETAIEFETGRLLSTIRCLQGLGDGILEFPGDIIKAIKMLPEAIKSLPGLAKAAYDNAGTLLQLTPVGFVMRLGAETSRGICEWAGKMISESPQDPVACAAYTAPFVAEETRINLANAEVLLTILQEMSNAAWELVKKEFPEYPCLAGSPTLQSRFWCNLIAKTLLTFLGPAEIKWGLKAGTAGIRATIRGTKWFKDTMTAMSKVLKATRELQIAEGVSLAEASERAAQMVSTTAELVKTQVVRMRFKSGELVEQATSLGKRLIYNKKVQTVVNGQTIEKIEQIPMGIDAATKVLDARQDIARSFLTDVLADGSKRGAQETIAVQVDVVSLGEINKTGVLADGTEVSRVIVHDVDASGNAIRLEVSGQAAGDFYLRRVTEIIQRNTRVVEGTDIVARWGGDEIGVFIRDVDRVKAKEILERINRAIYYDHDLRAIMDASPVARYGMKPSIAIGPTVYGAADTSVAAINHGDSLTFAVKREWYERHGMNATKYGGRPALSDAERAALPYINSPPPIPEISAFVPRTH